MQGGRDKYGGSFPTEPGHNLRGGEFNGTQDMRVRWINGVDLERDICCTVQGTVAAQRLDDVVHGSDVRVRPGNEALDIIAFENVPLERKMGNDPPQRCSQGPRTPRRARAMTRGFRRRFVRPTPARSPVRSVIRRRGQATRLTPPVRLPGAGQRCQGETERKPVGSMEA